MEETKNSTKDGKCEQEENITMAASTSAASLSPQMALEYTQALFKNAPRDGKMRPLVELVLPVPNSSGCEDSPNSSPSSPLSPSLSSIDKTDNHDLSFCPEAPDMRREDDRLKTFEKWPLTFLQPEVFARNGFYYLGRGDEVRCAFCKVEIMKWEEGDDPAVDHQRWAPQCPFLRRRAGVGNVPADSPPAAVDGHDECGVRAPSTPNPLRMSGPVHVRYASQTARLRSFSDWPRSIRQKPEDLADAGFFYTGQGDKTKCFYCDGGLKDWEDDDIPWEEHARWFNRCAFVQLVKGREYVQKVMSEAAAVTNPKEETKEEKPIPVSPVVTEKVSETEKNVVEDSKLCKICFAEERNVCFVPCGHVVACAKCALSTDKCPMCRRTLQNAVRLYFS